MLSFSLSPNRSIVTPSTPAAPPFFFTFSHASHTNCLEMTCDLPCNSGSLMRLLPFRLITFANLDDPAPWLPYPLRYAGGSRLLRASPPAHPATVLSSLRILPLRDLPLAASQADGSVGARLHKFRTRARTEILLPLRRTPPGQ